MTNFQLFVIHHLSFIIHHSSFIILTMNLVVLSPEKEIFTGEVKSVQVPGSDGGFQLLEGHAAIVASLKAGTVNVVKSNGEKLTFDVSGGFVECLNNEVSLLVAGTKE